MLDYSFLSFIFAYWWEFFLSFSFEAESAPFVSSHEYFKEPYYFSVEDETSKISCLQFMETKLWNEMYPYLCLCVSESKTACGCLSCCMCHYKSAATHGY